MRIERGFFARFFCENEFGAAGLETRFVQINNSLTGAKGTSCGLHYQLPPSAEVKVVRAIKGALWDVIVDLARRFSDLPQMVRRRAERKQLDDDVCPPRLWPWVHHARRNVEALYLDSAFYSPEARAKLERSNHRNQLAGRAM
jgi:dTDP-4-dehydrorhamnose 3,5-epimerase